MTKDLNPLSELTAHAVYHQIVAFQYSEDAYNFDFKRELGAVGTIFSSGGCGAAVVIVNEPKSSVVAVESAETTWSFFSPIGFRSSSYEGVIQLTDRSGFLFSETVRRFVADCGISLHHLTFAWVVVFTGVRGDSTTVTPIFSAPMFFHISTFSQNISGIEGRLYYFDIVSCYNSHGMSTRFSTLRRNTITHKDANTINTMPVPTTPSGGLQPTMAEDAAKLSSRDARLQKVKYMKTIEEFTRSFEVILNNQKQLHKQQVRTFMGLIRDDYTKKLSGIHSEPDLPIDYAFKVSEYYKNKKLNNMNLPFERREIDQNKFGLSSITFPVSYTIHSALATVMRMSKDVGFDHAVIPTTTFKFTTVSKRKCDGKYLIHTNINDFISPYNGTYGPNTGPGNGVVNVPIEYTYQDPTGNVRNDITISGIAYAAVPIFNLKPIEIVSDADDATAVYADREPITSKRKNDFAPKFFENSFSGIKSTRGLFSDNGVQNSEALASLTDFSPSQQNTYTLSVLGNPHLLNDINRNPNDIINGSPGHPIIYKFTEYEPMYLKLKIFLGGDRVNQSGGTYYYDGFLHIYKIVNTFTAGFFSRVLFCARTDEKT